MAENRVSVIIPVYGVEAFIERCAVSLLEQSLQEVEYIFVDDATPDRSIVILNEVIERYPQRCEQVHILHHDLNRGLPAARNTGLAYATGKYVFHADSDDFMDRQMLEHLYNAAERECADMIWCDWYLSFAQKERYMSQPRYFSTKDVLIGLLNGSMKYNVWNKLVKRSLYTQNKIEFPQGHNMAEDMTMIRLAACAQKVAYLPEAFYHYVKTNTSAMTTTFSNQHLKDIQYNVDETISFVRQKYGTMFESEIAYFKLCVKLPLLISCKTESYLMWSSLYTEANPWIMQNAEQSLRIRLVQWCAWKKQFWCIRLYYILIHKFIYGIIYK